MTDMPKTAKEAWNRVSALEKRMDRLQVAYDRSHELPSPEDHLRRIYVDEAVARVYRELRLAQRVAQDLETAETWPNGLPAHP